MTNSSILASSTKSNLPIEVQQYFQNVGAAFGSYSELSSFVSDKTLSYILTFPGFVAVVKPWSPQITLSNYGYVPGQQYNVFDSNHNFLYGASSASGTYGNENSIDVSTLYKQEHGSYLIINFPVERGYNLGLLWVCNKPNKANIRNQINKWIEESIIALNNLQVSTLSLYLGTLNISKIRIFILPGVWNQKFSPADIINHKLVIYEDFTFYGDTVLLNLNKTGWYVFYDNVNLQPLRLTNVNGVGEERLSINSNKTYFITLDDRGLFLDQPLLHPTNKQVILTATLANT
jgi:hypothetical protein